MNQLPLAQRLSRVILLLTILLVSGTVGYMVLEDWNVHDAIFMTVITLSTVGYGEVRPLTQGGEIFTMLMIFAGVGVLAYALSTTMDYIVAGELQGFLRRQRLARKMAKMEEHYIVCGYGRVGRQVVEELHANDIKLVVVDIDRNLVPEMEALGVPFVIGDPTDDDILQLAGIDRATGLCSCLPNDATNVFVVLSARQRNSKLLILSRCNQPENQHKLRIAGADTVINPYVITGRQMATQLLYPTVVEFLDVVIRRGDLELRLQEICIGADSTMAGQTLSDCQVRQRTGVTILAVRRDGQTLRTNPSGDFIFARGDELVCLGTPDQLLQLSKLARDQRRSLRIAD
jgi:voltage-gated potassium channel